MPNGLVHFLCSGPATFFVQNKNYLANNGSLKEYNGPVWRYQGNKWAIVGALREKKGQCFEMPEMTSGLSPPLI